MLCNSTSLSAPASLRRSRPHSQPKSLLQVRQVRPTVKGVLLNAGGIDGCSSKQCSGSRPSYENAQRTPNDVIYKQGNGVRSALATLLAWQATDVAKQWMQQLQGRTECRCMVYAENSSICMRCNTEALFDDILWMSGPLMSPSSFIQDWDRH